MTKEVIGISCCRFYKIKLVFLGFFRPFGGSLDEK